MQSEIKLVTVMLFFFSLLNLNCVAQTPSQTNSNQESFNILTIGDSNGAAENGWPLQLRKLLPSSTVINKSISGNTIGFNNLGQEKLNTLKNIDRYLDEAKSELGGDKNFDVILIGLGTNDTKKIFENQQNEVIENLRNLIKKINERTDLAFVKKPAIFIVSPPPMEEEKADKVKYGGGNQRIDSNNPQFEQVAGENRAFFIDINTGLKKLGAGFTTDGVHLTTEAQLNVAEKISSEIVKNCTIK